MTSDAIRLMTWNVGGIPFLRALPEDREAKKAAFAAVIRNVTEKFRPDIVLFQEIVRYNAGGNRHQAQDMIVAPPDYHYCPYVAIDTRRQNHPAKWDPVRESGRWSPDAYLAQGNAVMWRKDMPHCSIWDFRNHRQNTGRNLEAEAVRVDTGIFTGNRDTEPRLAVVAHFVHKATGRNIFVVNIHMTTLRGEREGFPERDDLGSKIRMNQVKIILNGIVSRYNTWREEQGRTQADERPVWILAGDFNAAPDSDEISRIRRMNFMDLCENSGGTGTKRSKRGDQASITVDYIFAGPQYFAFDPNELRERLKTCKTGGNAPPCGPVYHFGVETVSDHYPVFAWLPLPVKI